LVLQLPQNLSLKNSRPFGILKPLMNPKRALLVPLLLWCLTPALAGADCDSAKARALFKNPPRQYSTGPLWVWNDMLTEQEIRGTLHDLASQKVKQVWVHPRPGLMTPYLSDDWFRLWKVALDEAERLDMNVWIYDENSYPSGFAGGLVPDAMPESRGRGLAIKESKSAPKPSDALIGVYQMGETNFENVTARVKGGGTLPEGRYLVATQVRSGNSPWHGNRCYVNLLSPGVTEKFLELTLEPYRQEIGREFGRRVPGVFTDEPNIRPAGGLPWSEILVQEFQKRWGYNLLDFLPSLVRPVGDWEKIRHNYYQVLNEQFIEHWARPYHDYCASNHLEFTGHYWDHDWPDCSGVPDNMAMYAWHQLPAIDCLMNQYSEHTHAQFGNARMVRELSSIANQLGLNRTLCETYGAGGWDLRFEDMKRIGDWLEVLGVNTINQHLSYVTIRGARKRDHPQSFSYHEPWWRDYHISAEYFARLSAGLSQGQQVNRILLIEPTTTAWMHQGDSSALGKLGDEFFKVVMALEAAQIEYDIGCEDVIARHGSIVPAYARPAVIAAHSATMTLARHSELRVGNREYSRIIIPPLTENLNGKTMALLEELSQAPLGGRIFSLSDPPARVDGARSDRGDKLAKTGSWRKVDLAEIVDRLSKEPAAEGFSIRRSPRDKGILFHHRRRLADGELVFFVNTSIDSPSAGAFCSQMRGAQRWDLYTGKTEPYPCEQTSTGITGEFSLPPSGSLLLLLSSESGPPAPVRQEVLSVLSPSGPTEVRRCQPNVLTLDYVDITAGGEIRSNIYFYQANQFAFQKNGMDRNPWDSAVQFKDELISKKFPADSGFEASYRFTIQGAVPANLDIVIERPDLYYITCNGLPVGTSSDWWLDRSFGRIPIASMAHTGDNIVTLKASPFTIYHELEPAYLLGDFSLEPTDRGFVVAPEAPLRLDPTKGWDTQGHPFYSAGVTYREQFNLEKSGGAMRRLAEFANSRPRQRYFVHLPKWRGSVAEVRVNGKSAGLIDAPPWDCEVTRWTKSGQNTVEVKVIGTLKNTLGPHHGKPALGAAWPSAFHKAPESGPPPGAEYSTVAYGLFEPFVIKKIEEHPATEPKLEVSGDYTVGE